jgi:hypothetical protein
MANRLVSNMYIIDSNQCALPLLYGSSATVCTTANCASMRVMSVVFIAVDTTAQCSIALMDTNNVVMDYKLIKMGSGNDSGLANRTSVEHFGYGVPWKGVFIPTITACTAVLVLE